MTDINVMFDSRYGTKFLLSQNANPNIQDRNGYTALHKLVIMDEKDKNKKAILLKNPFIS